MATYVNNLRLTELATGEGSGTWGTTTNTNLELIGEALGYGSEAIANASTHTITVADGTADSARSFYLKLTGGGQACTVTLAPNTLSKVWMVENTTNSTLTFSQGSGANVAVPAGQVKMIATDGAGSGAVVYDLLVDTDLTGTTTVVNLTSSGTIDAATVEFNSLSGTGSVAITDILDQDNMSSDSATALATQQSIKAYVDSSVASFDTLAEVLAQGNTTGSTDIEVTSAQKVQFRDSAIYINSSTDGQLDIVADTEIQIAATTIDINGAINASGEIIAASLDISGNIDVDGTTNLDVVDIDGAVQLDNTLTVGVNDTGYDVKFFGATSGLYTEWDESQNLWRQRDEVKSVYGNGDDLQIYHTATGNHSIISESGSGNLVLAADNLEINNAANNENKIVASTNGAVTLFYDNAAKLATASGGISVTGEVAATSLDISGDIDVDGTTNLDVVDIDGAVDMASTLGVAGIITATSSSSGDYVRLYGGSGTGKWDIYASGANLRFSDNESAGALQVDTAMAVSGVLTANAGVVVDNITIDGNEIDVGSGVLTLDVASDIRLDAGGGNIQLLKGGTEFGRFFEAGTNDFYVYNPNSDKDIIIYGNDAGTSFEAARFDMSAAGNATFNGTVLASNGTASLPSLSFSGDSNTGIYRSGSDNLGFAIGGQARAFMSGTQFNMTGNGIFSGNGTFGGTLGVTGAATFSSAVSVAGVGVIGATDGDLNIYSTAANHGGLRLGNGYIGPTNNAGTITNDAISLGLSSHRYTNLYLSDSVQNSGKAGSATIFNEDGTTADFRVESDSQTHMFFIDGGTNKIAIGHAVPDTELHVIANGNDAQMPFIIGNENITSNSTSQSVAMGFGLARDSGTVKNNAGLITVGKELAWTADDAQVDSFMNFSTYQNNAAVSRVHISSNGNTKISATSFHPLTLDRLSQDTAGQVEVHSNGTARAYWGASSTSLLNVANASFATRFNVDYNGSIFPSGNVVMANGQGVDFSATAGSGTSELLDDYEEGTWTPTLPNGGSLNVNRALYTKIGRQVSVQFYISAINATNDGAQFLIGGLPFTTSSTSNSYSAGSISYCGESDLSGLGLLNLVNGTSLYFHFIDGTSGASVANNTFRGLLASASAGVIIAEISYFTD